MCVTFFCLSPRNLAQNGIEFVIGFNRDEQTKRETDPLVPFAEDSNIYAGKDKKSGGTWLGINIKTGIMVILTNYDLPVERYGKSRGKLVLSFLKTENFEKIPLENYDEHIKSRLCEILQIRQKYSAFNLLIYSIQTEKLFYICSEMKLNEPKMLEKGEFYGMCNGSLDDVWEKTEHGLDKFKKIVKSMSEEEKPEQFFFNEAFMMLKDNVLFDSDLEKEASIFIKPYFSENEKAERMTKCSFCCIIKKNKEKNEFSIEMKEVTYTSPKLEESKVEYRKIIGIDSEQQKY